MPDSDSDDENDVPSSSGTTQNQSGYEGNDDDLVNSMCDHIMFQMYFNYN